MTRENLKQKGWEDFNSDFIPTILNPACTQIPLIKNNYLVFYKNPQMVILNKTNELIYNGYCESIEDFDNITRLLKIK